MGGARRIVYISGAPRGREDEPRRAAGGRARVRAAEGRTGSRRRCTTRCGRRGRLRRPARLWRLSALLAAGGRTRPWRRTGQTTHTGRPPGRRGPQAGQRERSYGPEAGGSFAIITLLGMGFGHFGHNGAGGAGGVVAASRARGRWRAGGVAGVRGGGGNAGGGALPVPGRSRRRAVQHPRQAPGTVAEFDRPVGICELVTVDTTGPLDVGAVAALVRGCLGDRAGAWGIALVPGGSRVPKG